MECHICGDTEFTEELTGFHCVGCGALQAERREEREDDSDFDVSKPVVVDRRALIETEASLRQKKAKRKVSRYAKADGTEPPPMETRDKAEVYMQIQAVLLAMSQTVSKHLSLEPSRVRADVFRVWAAFIRLARDDAKVPAKLKRQRRSSLKRLPPLDRQLILTVLWLGVLYSCPTVLPCDVVQWFDMGFLDIFKPALAEALVWRTPQHRQWRESPVIRHMYNPRLERRQVPFVTVGRIERVARKLWANGVASVDVDPWLLAERLVRIGGFAGDLADKILKVSASLLNLAQRGRRVNAGFAKAVSWISFCGSYRNRPDVYAAAAVLAAAENILYVHTCEKTDRGRHASERTLSSLVMDAPDGQAFLDAGSFATKWHTLSAESKWSLFAMCREFASPPDMYVPRADDQDSAASLEQFYKSRFNLPPAFYRAFSRIRDMKDEMKRTGDEIVCKGETKRTGDEIVCKDETKRTGDDIVCGLRASHHSSAPGSAGGSGGMASMPAPPSVLMLRLICAIRGNGVRKSSFGRWQRVLTSKTRRLQRMALRQQKKNAQASADKRQPALWPMRKQMTEECVNEFMDCISIPLCGRLGDVLLTAAGEQKRRRIAAIRPQEADDGRLRE